MSLQFSTYQERQDAQAQKYIDWSYPTSDNARKSGFYDSGCWGVHVEKRDKRGFFGLPKLVSGFATYEEAESACNDRPEPLASVTYGRCPKCGRVKVLTDGACMGRVSAQECREIEALDAAMVEACRS